MQAFVPCGASICVGGDAAGAQCATNADCSPPGFEPGTCQSFPVNASTDMGVSSCKLPVTYNEVKGSPANGWMWGPHSYGSVSFKASAKRIPNPLNPIPNTADVIVDIRLRDIQDAAGLVDGDGVLWPTRRTTFEDRMNGDMTVVDLSVPNFRVSLVGGAARVKTSANVWLNEIHFPGVPGCTSLELVDLELRDENDTLFARPGIFLPDINPN